MKYLSLLIILCLASCAVKQNLTEANKLTVGMSKVEVSIIMGDPIKTDFYDSYEEWHYCKTGIINYEYIALFFSEGKLIAKKNYIVMQDVEKGIYGSCEKFIKMGNYLEPDQIREIRVR